MGKRLNICKGTVRLVVAIYVLLNGAALFFASSAITDTQNYTLSTKALTGDNSFFICNENEKDGEDDDFKSQLILQNSFQGQPFSTPISYILSAREFFSCQNSPKVYLVNRSLLL